MELRITKKRDVYSYQQERSKGGGELNITCKGQNWERFETIVKR